jgi:hypothetical protein
MVAVERQKYPQPLDEVYQEAKRIWESLRGQAPKDPDVLVVVGYFLFSINPNSQKIASILQVDAEFVKESVVHKIHKQPYLSVFEEVVKKFDIYETSTKESQRVVEDLASLIARTKTEKGITLFVPKRQKPNYQELDQKVWEALNKDNTITNSDLARMFKLSKSQIEHSLKRLRRQGRMPERQPRKPEKSRKPFIPH